MTAVFSQTLANFSPISLAIAVLFVPTIIRFGLVWIVGRRRLAHAIRQGALTVFRELGREDSFRPPRRVE